MRIPIRTAQRLKASVPRSRRDALRQLVDDLQFLMLRQEEFGWIMDWIASVHYRRQWVEEREAFEQQRSA